jgi:hypothetical protein
MNDCARFAAGLTLLASIIAASPAALAQSDIAKYARIIKESGYKAE